MVMTGLHAEPTRTAALARLERFLPHAGRDYATRRNYDFGPENRANVSGLSPWLRRRILTEQEVITAVLEQHSPAAAEKFIQEVCWRTYWKGWLELRPHVLVEFRNQRRQLSLRRSREPALRHALERAEGGATGIDGFDAWVSELVGSGWLHNHARMWFASIWIFTLRLPWQLGADFFYKHLLDADPASNTLSWRWVAGLQTPGKHYLARAANIRRYTDGRFDPSGKLDERATALEGPAPPPAGAMPASDPAAQGPVLLLLTDEDLHPESWPLDAAPRAVAALSPTLVGPPDSPAARFSSGALDDALVRAAAYFDIESLGVLQPDAVAAAARSAGARSVVTAYAPVGLTAWSLAELGRELADRGAPLLRVRRAWDEAAWPHARAGFFRFKAQIPKLLRQFCGAPDR